MSISSRPPAATLGTSKAAQSLVARRSGVVK
jgi:hypothetical protein